MSYTAGEHENAFFKLITDKMVNDNAISRTAYNLWFENCKIKKIDSKNVYLTVENETKKDSILSHYKDILAEYFSNELGYNTGIIIDTDFESNSDNNTEDNICETESKEEKEFAEKDAKYEKYDSLKTESSLVGKNSYFKRNSVYTFDTYVVGSSNSLAYNAAKTISKKPSDEFNPLYIYGPSGIGKTHLMYATANEILNNYPEKTVIYVKGEEFVSSLVGSLKEGTMDIFRNKYRNADVLLVDDIQVIAGKKTTQEEFFYTFDALYEKHKQIILSSDCAPSDIAILVDRLKGRFSMGLVTDIQLPDFELRLAILRKKSENVGINLSDDILEFLAEKLHSNIREIEGVIKKLSALSFFTGKKIDFETASQCAAEFTKDELTEDEKINMIIEETATVYNISVKDILGKKRDKNIKNARNIAMYIIKAETEKSLVDIGIMFDRTHPTVHSNIETVKREMDQDPFLVKKIEDIQQKLKR